MEQNVTMRTTEEENQYWYYGMTPAQEGLTKLIARSSTFKFQSQRNSPHERPSDPWIERRRKVMATVGKHKITQIYDNKLRHIVKDALSEITWETVDVVRLGYDDDRDQHQPVVLITVTEPVDGDKAQQVVDRIHQIMIENDLREVHAEVKTGKYFAQAIYTPKYRYPLEFRRVPSLGCSIGRENLAGSLCLFMKVKGENFALTCQHVVLDASKPTVGDNVLITQPAQGDIDKERTEIDVALKGAKSRLESFNDSRQKFHEGLAPPPSKSQVRGAAKDQGEIDEYTSRMATIAQFEQHMTFGTLHCTPEVAKHSVNGSIRDWALIKLSEARFQDQLPLNRTPDTHFTTSDIYYISQVYPESNYRLDFDDPLSEIVPVAEIRDIITASGPYDHQDYHSMRIFKHGRTSGWTAGSLNEIRSDCRRDELETTELCVVNIPDMNNFSFKGDSGACVIDIKGRILGMLHSGNGKAQLTGAEISYITPMAWIIEDIKETLGTDDVALEMRVEE